MIRQREGDDVAGTISVKPEILRSKAHEIDGYVNTLEKQWKIFEDTVTRSKSYWEGEAGTEHQLHYKDVKDDVKTIIRMLKEHPKDMLKMAGVYDEAEKVIQDNVNELSVNVIF